eukprot:TRINITY_DN87182_c0_g1_i1.p1 TRINITY_DN87182_c0_g1~~TRINITY_DN87182_c0_g1_i1.p1  ORF type:complete len:596 (-),score=102.24 TRINITY_DN87182_c0_g1_i1:190-1977(-)
MIHRKLGACSAAALLLSCSLQLSAGEETRVDSDFVQTGECIGRFRPPQKVPRTATYYNGLIMNDTCFSGGFDRKKIGNPVFLIGDWGGINYGFGPVPADHTKTADPNKRREHNWVIDGSAQQRVAGKFNWRAQNRQPDYIINVGDNFYWGGVECQCGRPMWDHCDTAQWKYIYEAIYKGPGVDGKQWLGVLGNHDWGGWRFDKGWDQVIAYTWGGLPESTGRWVQPAIYYKARVLYEDFKVDYFFIDTNIFDVKDNPWFDPVHNICGVKHANPWSGCGEEGPGNAWDCKGWFSKIWTKQQVWLEKLLKQSIVDKVEWQVIVTHFPPWWGEDHWKYLANQYGIELFITGHVHRQDVLNKWRWDNQFKPSVVVITGGGGGITSELFPDYGGNDDQYGFMDMTLWKDQIKIEALSHGGQIRSTTMLPQRGSVWQPETDDAPAGPSSSSPLDCKVFMQTSGCGWTKQYNCPGQPAGTDGVASGVGTDGYECCCTLGLWKEGTADATTAAPTDAPSVPAPTDAPPAVDATAGSPAAAATPAVAAADAAAQEEEFTGTDQPPIDAAADAEDAPAADTLAASSTPQTSLESVAQVDASSIQQ